MFIRLLFVVSKCGFILFLFWSVFNDAVGSSGCIVVNYGIINERQILKDLKVDGQGLIWGTISGYGWRNRGKPQKPQSAYSISLPKFKPVINQTQVSHLWFLVICFVFALVSWVVFDLWGFQTFHINKLGGVDGWTDGRTPIASAETCSLVEDVSIMLRLKKRTGTISDTNIKAVLHMRSDSKYEHVHMSLPVKITGVSPSEFWKSAAVRNRRYICKNTKLRKEWLPEMLPAGLRIGPSEGSLMNMVRTFRFS